MASLQCTQGTYATNSDMQKMVRPTKNRAYPGNQLIREPNNIIDRHLRKG